MTGTTPAKIRDFKFRVKIIPENIYICKSMQYTIKSIIVHGNVCIFYRFRMDRDHFCQLLAVFSSPFPVFVAG